MKELIERLEKATGPDRELANEVLLACGWTIDEYGPGPDRARIWQDPDPKGEDYLDGDQPDPLASADAAMMLVPQGWNRRFSESDTHKWWAELREGYETSYNRVAIGQAATLPLAISSAALRARESQP